MRIEPADGFFGEDMIVFEGLHRDGYISRGFEVMAPDLEQADPVHHNTLESDLIALLSVLKPEWRMQVQWTNDSDFRKPLQRYREDTIKYSTNAWSTRQRNERFVRYSQLMDQGALRRERLRLYFTMPVDAEAIGQKSGRFSHEALLSAYAEQI